MLPHTLGFINYVHGTDLFTMEGIEVIDLLTGITLWSNMPATYKFFVIVGVAIKLKVSDCVYVCYYRHKCSQGKAKWLKFHASAFKL